MALFPPTSLVSCTPLRVSSCKFQADNGLSQYRARDKPWYPLGHGIILAYIAIGFFSSLTYMILLRRENMARDRGERDELILPGGEGENVGTGGRILIDEDRKGKGGHESEEDMRRRRNGVFESVEAARREKGDLWSGFRYSL